VAIGELARAQHRLVQCLLRLAWDSEIDCEPIAQPAEPQDADPHVRWCGRGGAARHPPIPIGTGLIAGRFFRLLFVERTARTGIGILLCS